MSTLAVSPDPSADPSSRRERKKHRTRAELIAAATRLFAEHGFDQTTTEAIADAADVSQRTFFRHFTSKEAVLYGDRLEVEAAFQAAILARPADEPPLLAVAAALRASAAPYSTDRERTLLQARLAASSPSVSAYSRAVVQRGLERAIVAALAERMGVNPLVDPRPEVIAGAAMSALRAALRKWAAHGGRGNLREMAAAALLSLRDGVA